MIFAMLLVTGGTIGIVAFAINYYKDATNPWGESKW